MCNVQGRGLIEELIQVVDCTTGGCHQSNFVLHILVEACPGNLIEDILVFLSILPSLFPISFQIISIGSD
jgi:hypothetical protein